MNGYCMPVVKKWAILSSIIGFLIGAGGFYFVARFMGWLR